MKDPNFYITVAQIIPVLLLALVWEGAYLTRVESGKTKGQSFWKPKQVVIWSWLILPSAVIVELLCILATDVGWLRNEFCGWVVVIVMIGLLATLLVRMLADVSGAASKAKAAHQAEDDSG